MKPLLPLDKMSVSEKLQVMEEIWESLRDTSDAIPSPAWHADVLKARKVRVRKGTSRFLDWTEVKHRIRERKR